MVSVKIDMHVHTKYSGDSLIQPKDMIKWAIKKGLDGIAICDHNTLKAYKYLKTLIKDNDFIVIPAMEINTHIGEVIGLFIDNEIDLKDNNFFTIVDKIKENNGLVVVPHPFDLLRDDHLKMDLLTDEIIEKKIDGIEILNSRIIFNRYVKKAKGFNKKYNLFETAGSDAHSKKEIGNAYTYIKDIDDKSPDSIRKGLLANKSVSQGKLSSPLVHVITVINNLKNRKYF